MSDANRGRIAIKFGAGASSSSRPSRLTPPSALGKRPRSHHALGGASDSESDDDRDGRHEAITGFGAQGAETHGGEEKGPKEYVIERQANRNWRDELRAARRVKDQRGHTKPEQDQRSEHTKVEQDERPEDGETEGLKWGLTITQRKKAPEEDDVKKAKSRVETPAPAPKDAPAPRTADEEAMDALLGKVAEKKEHVIPSQMTEDDAYRRDVETAGAPSTLQDYEAMPVEEFGAALLRGMGWTGENQGPKVREVRRRPNRLGLGAKELKEEEDLGGWNQNGGKKHRPRLNEYRREEDRRKESRRGEDSYKTERERERRRDRDADYHRHRERHHERDRRR